MRCIMGVDVSFYHFTLLTAIWRRSVLECSMKQSQVCATFCHYHDSQTWWEQFKVVSVSIGAARDPTCYFVCIGLNCAKTVGRNWLWRCHQLICPSPDFMSFSCEHRLAHEGVFAPLIFQRNDDLIKILQVFLMRLCHSEFVARSLLKRLRFGLLYVRCGLRSCCTCTCLPRYSLLFYIHVLRREAVALTFIFVDGFFGRYPFIFLLYTFREPVHFHSVSTSPWMCFVWVGTTAHGRTCA